MMTLLMAAACLQDDPGAVPEHTIDARFGIWNPHASARFRSDAEPTEGTYVELGDREVAPWVSLRLAKEGGAPSDILEINYWAQTWEEDINSFEIFDGRVVAPGSDAEAAITTHFLEFRALLNTGQSDVLTMRGGITIPILWTLTELENESHSSRAGGLGFCGVIEAKLPNLPIRFGADVGTAFLLGWRDFGWTFDLKFFVGFEYNRFSLEFGDHFFRDALTNYPSRNDARSKLELHGLYIAVGVKF